jgi:hypothetical protein
MRPVRSFAASGRGDELDIRRPPPPGRAKGGASFLIELHYKPVPVSMATPPLHRRGCVQRPRRDTGSPVPDHFFPLIGID